jgi:hypothetical protein
MEFLSLFISHAGDTFPFSHENAPSKWPCSQLCATPAQPRQPQRNATTSVSTAARQPSFVLFFCASCRLTYTQSFAGTRDPLGSDPLFASAARITFGAIPQAFGRRDLHQHRLGAH